MIIGAIVGYCLVWVAYALRLSDRFHDRTAFEFSTSLVLAAFWPLRVVTRIMELIGL